MTRSSRLAICNLLLSVITMTSCHRINETTYQTALQRLKSGGLEVALLSPRDALQHGSDMFLIEFRSADGNRVDVGTVRSSASMPMPGMPMFGSIDVHRTSVVGQYAADTRFEMAGTWQMTIEWDGPAGHGALKFSQMVH
jgi:YtkA-like